MAYDPLSNTTRRNRTQLLIASTAAVFTYWFDLQVSQIAALSAKFTFDPSLLPVLLLTMISYSLVAFIIYLLDDTRNREKSVYEKKLEDDQLRIFEQQEAINASCFDEAFQKYMDDMNDAIFMIEEKNTSESQHCDPELLSNIQIELNGLYGKKDLLKERFSKGDYTSADALLMKR